MDAYVELIPQWLNLVLGVMDSRRPASGGVFSWFGSLWWLRLDGKTQVTIEYVCDQLEPLFPSCAVRWFSRILRHFSDSVHVDVESQ